MIRRGLALLAFALVATCGAAGADPAASQPATSPAAAWKDGLSLVVAVAPVKAVCGPKDRLAFELTFTNTTQDAFCIYNKLLDGKYANDKELSAAGGITFTDTKTKQSWRIICDGEISRDPRNTPTMLLKPAGLLGVTLELEDNLKFAPAGGGKSQAQLPPGNYEAVITLRFENYPAKMRYWAGEITSAPIMVEIAERQATAPTTSASSPDAAQVQAQIKLLGDSNRGVREGATRKLLEIGEPARASLQQAAVGADLEVAARAKEILASLDGLIRGLDGKLLERYRGQKVLVLFHAYPVGKIGEDNREAHRKLAQEIEASLAKAKVSVVRVVTTSRDFLDQDTSIHFDQMMLLDCQGQDPAEALKDIPHRQAAIVFVDGAYKAGLPSPADAKGRVPAPWAYQAWGTGNLPKRDVDLARYEKLQGVKVDYVPPQAGGAGAGGAAGYAKLTAVKDLTLLEVFLLTKAGFFMQAAPTTTSASSPAATEPGKIDTRKSGFYKFGKWEYRLTVGKGLGALRSGESTASGSLSYDGKAILGGGQNDTITTPWGRMYWSVQRKDGLLSGWLTWTDDARAGKQIYPPEGE